MDSEDHRRLADELENEAHDMERRSEELQDEVQDTRQDWERKRADPSVPGAVPQDGEEGSEERQPQPGDD